MHFVKKYWQQRYWTCIKNVIYVMDHAYIQARYWDERKTRYKATVITRLKSTFVYEVLETLPVEKTENNTVTNKVTTIFSVSLCTPITYTSYSHPTALSRLILFNTVLTHPFRTFLIRQLIYDTITTP